MVRVSRATNGKNGCSSECSTSVCHQSTHHHVLEGTLVLDRDDLVGERCLFLRSCCAVICVVVVRLRGNMLWSTAVHRALDLDLITKQRPPSAPNVTVS